MDYIAAGCTVADCTVGCIVGCTVGVAGVVEDGAVGAGDTFRRDSVGWGIGSGSLVEEEVGAALLTCLLLQGAAGPLSSCSEYPPHHHYYRS